MYAGSRGDASINSGTPPTRRTVPASSGLLPWHWLHAHDLGHSRCGHLSVEHHPAVRIATSRVSGVSYRWIAHLFREGGRRHRRRRPPSAARTRAPRTIVPFGSPSRRPPVASGQKPTSARPQALSQRHRLFHCHGIGKGEGGSTHRQTVSDRLDFTPSADLSQLAGASGSRLNGMYATNTAKAERHAGLPHQPD